MLRRIGSLVYRLALMAFCVFGILAGWRGATSNEWIRNRYSEELPAWPAGLFFMAASIAGLAWLIFHGRELD